MSRTVRVVVLAALMIFVFAAASASAATPELGSSPDWSSVDGAVPYGDGHAIPLEAAQPAWFTDELAAAGHEAVVCPTTHVDLHALQQADLVVVGGWTDGLFFEF